MSQVEAVGPTEESAAALRQRAEDAWRLRAIDLDQQVAPDQALRLVHELQVHQIELEMQNEELQRVQKELEASYGRYFNLYDLAPVGYVTLNNQWLIEGANLTFASLVEVDRATLVGLPLTNFIIPEDQDIFYLQRRRLDETGVLQSCDLHMVRHGGGPVWVNIESILEPRPAGGPPSYWATVTDISARKQAEDEIQRDISRRKSMEAALRESERLYRLLAENMQDVLTLTDPEGRMIYVSPSVVGQTGYTPEEVLQRTLTDNFTPESALALKRLQATSDVNETTGKPRLSGPHVLAVTCKDGSTIWTETINSDLRDESNHVLGRISVVRDITQRRHLEQQLRISEEKFAKAFVANPAGIIITQQADGRILDANPAYVQMTGYSHAELVGHSTVELGIVDAAQRVQLVDSALSTGTRRDADARLNTKTGTSIDVIGLVEPIEMDGVPCLLGMILDITERKRIEKLLQELNEDLDHRVAERTAELGEALAELKRANQAKDEFLAAVSHELRTPLTGVLGMADALEMQYSSQFDDRQRRYVRIIRESGTRLLALVNGILQYTGLIAGRVTLQPEACHLADLCRLALQTIHLKAEQKELAMTFNVEPADLEIISDASAITQVLRNLLDNAVKFTPQGGRIGLTVSAVEGERTVQFVVWDTGIGIAADDQSRILQPFVQVDSSLARSYEGVGLGLAYANRMVELLGGALTIESTLGQGSRFTVLLSIGHQFTSIG